MKLESLTIQLRQPFSPLGPDNKYEAKLSVSWNETKMQVALTEDACRRILELAGDEIAAAAQIQISDFVTNALSASQTPAIEGKAEQ
ncbi:hypothetical protein [Tritonibacter mobilis]|uniref:hypothetical protein n=1 Tax=Tritonibacter mobilis TaxID=379347 RepID=UPI0008069548|nr:hypothetical protein [Tritonibacter mobilis]